MCFNQSQILPLKVHEKHVTYSSPSPWDSADDEHTRIVTVAGLEVSQIFQNVHHWCQWRSHSIHYFVHRLKFHHQRVLSIIPPLGTYNSWHPSFIKTCTMASLVYFYWEISTCAILTSISRTRLPKFLIWYIPPFENSGIGIGTTNMAVTLKLTITLTNIIKNVWGSWK